MTPAYPAALLGNTVLTHRDNFAVTAHQLGRRAIIAGLLLTVLVLGSGLITSAASDDASVSGSMTGVIGQALAETWQALFNIWILFPGIIAVITAIKWARHPVPNKTVSYSVDAEGVTSSDAAGASLSIPWSMVKQSRRTRSYVLMTMKAGGLRFLPFRAFSADDGEKLWQLVCAQTPVKQIRSGRRPGSRPGQG
jgi:hypothetical protein